MNGEIRNKLVNIEIKGADHYDYMQQGLDLNLRGGIVTAIGDYIASADDRAWNQRVADFVTDLTLNSHNIDSLNNFLNLRNEARFDEINNKWIIEIEGWEERV